MSRIEFATSNGPLYPEASRDERIDLLGRHLREIQENCGQRLDLLEVDDLADALFGDQCMSAFDVRRVWSLVGNEGTPDDHRTH